MIKRTIKLRIHNPKCDFRNSQYGNWIDLHLNGQISFEGLKTTPGTNIIVPDNKIVGLGISMTLPKWYRCEIKPRSSTFKKWGLILTNSVGEIEYDYFKEYKANFLAFKDVTIPDGERILQMQISLRPDAPFYMKLIDLFVSGFRYEEVDVLTTNRDGYGSSDNLNTQNLVIA